MTGFMIEDFILSNETARRLYHEHAAEMPIYDYHCHLPAELIATDHNYDNLAQIWLAGDHYKWRAMRTNGVNERYVTGEATDYEKFQQWAATVPYCIGNPLYHWTHMELKKPFGITDLLNPDTADRIYKNCAEMLQQPDFSVRGLLRKFNVKLVCTTEDPLDSLEHHEKIAAEDFDTKVRTAWRPDKAMAVEDPVAFNDWVDRLGELTGMQINSYNDFLSALKSRHNYFHDHGCRLSDIGLTRTFFVDYSEAELKAVFVKLRKKNRTDNEEILKFKTAMLVELSAMNAEKGWTQQFHIGALRNNNTKMFNKLGPDTGFDSIADYPIADGLAKLLDRLESMDKLTRTIFYNLNPADNATIATLMGCYQDGSIPGKMQFGSAWWFLDQKNGMEQQLQTLADLGLLSRFIGMLTDSRSFLSFSRHEYFRRILCNMLGTQAEQGLIPNDKELLGSIVRDICYNNARQYLELDKITS